MSEGRSMAKRKKPRVERAITVSISRLWELYISSWKGDETRGEEADL